MLLHLGSGIISSPLFGPSWLKISASLGAVASGGSPGWWCWHGCSAHAERSSLGIWGYPAAWGDGTGIRSRYQAPRLSLDVALWWWLSRAGGWWQQLCPSSCCRNAQQRCTSRDQRAAKAKCIHDSPPSLGSVMSLQGLEPSGVLGAHPACPAASSLQKFRVTGTVPCVTCEDRLGELGVFWRKLQETLEPLPVPKGAPKKAR